MPIVLSQLVSPNVTLDVRSAGLPQGAGGIALHSELYDGPLAFALSDDEARWLMAQIERRLSAH